jgi:hypothetical protein
VCCAFVKANFRPFNKTMNATDELSAVDALIKALTVVESGLKEGSFLRPKLKDERNLNCFLNKTIPKILTFLSAEKASSVLKTELKLGILDDDRADESFHSSEAGESGAITNSSPNQAKDDDNSDAPAFDPPLALLPSDNMPWKVATLPQHFPYGVIFRFMKDISATSLRNLSFSVGSRHRVLLLSPSDNVPSYYYGCPYILFPRYSDAMEFRKRLEGRSFEGKPLQLAGFHFIDNVVAGDLYRLAEANRRSQLEEATASPSEEGDEHYTHAESSPAETASRTSDLDPRPRRRRRSKAKRNAATQERNRSSAGLSNNDASNRPSLQQTKCTAASQTDNVAFRPAKKNRLTRSQARVARVVKTVLVALGVHKAVSDEVRRDPHQHTGCWYPEGYYWYQAWRPAGIY